MLVGKLTALGGLAPDPELVIDPGYVSSASIVGREKEIALLSGLLAETRDGGSRAFVVEAESGAGKSRLVQELLLQAKLDGILALHIACEQQTGGPYGVIAHLIDEAFSAAPEQAQEAAEDDAELLGRLFAPVRKRFRSTVTPGAPAEPAEERMRSQKAVTGFFRVVRHVDGAWIVPDDIALEHASTGLADAMRARVGQLPEHVRALGALLAMMGGEVSLLVDRSAAAVVRTSGVRVLSRHRGSRAQPRRPRA